MSDPHTQDVMLTTIDNPWNPFTHWEEWLSYDESSGYQTSGLLARLTVTSNELSETDNDLAIREGIQKVLSLNPIGIHIAVTRDYKPKPNQSEKTDNSSGIEK